LRRPFSLFVVVRSRTGSAINHAKLRTRLQQTVDGMQRALEIHARSSYVPSSTIGVRSPDYRITRAKSGAVARLDLPTWMK
jgi:hypothetical protein